MDETNCKPRQSKRRQYRFSKGIHVPRIAERWKQALELYLSGRTYAEIARRLGYHDASSAYRAVQTAIREMTVEPTKELIELELLRLDALQCAWWPRAIGGQPEDSSTPPPDPVAAGVVLKIMARRDRLLGLETSTNAEISGSK